MALRMGRGVGFDIQKILRKKARGEMEAKVHRMKIERKEYPLAVYVIAVVR